MNETQHLHASTLISLLHPAPHASALIEITGLMPKSKPVKRYRTLPELAVDDALELDGMGYNAFVNVNPRREMAAFESSVPYVTALALDIQPERIQIAEAEARLVRAGMPPTAAVVSGYGAHFYLVLTEPAETSRAKLLWERLCHFVTSDSIFSLNRIMRMPGTRNWKKKPPVWCSMTSINADRRYSIEDVAHKLDRVGAAAVLPHKEGIPVSVDPPEDWMHLHQRLSPGVLDVINTGEKNAFSERQVTRSEADWMVVMALVNAGASDEMIAWVYANNPIQNLKYRRAGAHYLTQTIVAARRAAAVPLQNRPVTRPRAMPSYTGGAADSSRSRYANGFYR